MAHVGKKAYITSLSAENIHDVSIERSNNRHADLHIPAQPSLALGQPEPYQEPDSQSPVPIFERLRYAPSGIVNNLKQRLSDEWPEEPCPGPDCKITTFPIPEQATDIANIYADELHSQSLREPLHRFLLSAASAPALEGISLVIWNESDFPASLSIYAMTNLTSAYENQYRAPSAAGAVRSAYYTFRKALIDDQSTLRPDLSFYNTGGDNLSSILLTLAQDLLKEEFMGVKMTSGAMSLLSVAVPSSSPMPTMRSINPGVPIRE
jgi:hypothetical protein